MRSYSVNPLHDEPRDSVLADVVFMAFVGLVFTLIVSLFV